MGEKTKLRIQKLQDKDSPHYGDVAIDAEFFDAGTKEVRDLNKVLEKQLSAGKSR